MDCPKCGEEMEYSELDETVGIMQGGWVCLTCQDENGDLLFVPDEGREPMEGDVDISGGYHE